MTKQEFLNKAFEKHKNKYLYLDLSEKILSSDNITMMYDGIAYTQKVCKHLMGRCPEKNTPTKTTKDFIKEAKKIWNNKYDYSMTEYKGANKKIKIIYEGIIFEQTPSSHLQGFCVEKALTLENFINKSKKIHGENKYDYSLIKKIINGETPVQIKYKGIIYLQKPYNHLSGNCPEKQILSIKKTNKQFINESNQIHDFKYSYDKTNYIKNQSKIIITCPEHGDFLQRPLSHIQGMGCPSCNESKGEKKIASFLKKNKINFDRQKKFTNCKNIYELPFDFYIPSKRICIEFDGKQHFEPLTFFGGLKAFEKLKINDNIKNNFCEDNYINLIRIKYTEIDKIEEILNNYF
jgi:very-short-patch-repair endonuclease